MATSSKASKKTKITVVEVAAAAGVSISAVSRAFSNGSCSLDMRDKVFAAAKLLGYKPNRLARGLKAKSGLIGILVTDFDNPAYLPILQQFSAQIQQKNCHSLLVNAHDDRSIKEALELVMEYHIEGLVVTATSLPQILVDACTAQDIPVVCFARNSLSNGASAVFCDNISNGKMAANLLLDAGYTKPAFVSGPVAALTSRERQRGFINRLVERGCEDWQIVEGGNHSYDAGYEATCKLLALQDQPDAIFFTDDIMACGGMDAARYRFNLRVPQDLGIIGVDDIQLASSPAYQLTTIKQPFSEMVSACVTSLFAQIADPEKPPEQIIFPCELQLRHSTARDS
ncbi:MAG: LacI family DNA-binding transcriptional regulator [Oceanospirillaceae bacterium]